MAKHLNLILSKYSDVISGKFPASKVGSLTLGNNPGVDYAPVSKGDRDFIAAHSVEMHPDRNGNGDDLFKASNIKMTNPKKHGNIRPKDAILYKQTNEAVFNERKDEAEYGYEGEMAITQLKTISRNSKNLMMLLKPDTDLPEWVQSKITKAEDYISTAYDYLASEMTEEVDQIHEAHMSERDAESLAQKHVNAAISAKKAGDLKGHAAHAEASNDIRDMILKHTDSPEGIPSAKIQRTAKRLFGKSADQINEISPDTSKIKHDYKGLKAYVDSLPKNHPDRRDLLTAVSHMAFGNEKHLAQHIEKLDTDVADKVEEYMMKEEADQTNLGGGKGPIGGKYGMPSWARNRVTQAMAAAKVAKQKKQQANRLTKEEVEQIDELSKKAIGDYIKKAKDDLGNRESEVTRNRYVDPRGVKDILKHNNALLMKRANRRDKINKAVDKLATEETDQIYEANSYSEVAKLKSKGEHHEAGVLAAEAGHPRQYGVHFGMRSDIKKAKDDFYQGYDSVKKTNEEVDQIDEAKCNMTEAGSICEIHGKQNCSNAETENPEDKNPKYTGKKNKIGKQLLVDKMKKYISEIRRV